MSKSLHKSLEAKLAALDGPEWDSSDEETPMIPMTDSAKNKSTKQSNATKGKKGKQSKQSSNEEHSSRVIYLGHLPPNFEEPELEGFLQQFGHITKLRLSRSKKTSNSRGYAFCEFANAKVATIVADTMSGYLMSQKRLVCHLVPNDKIHPSMFDGHDRKWKTIDWRGMHRERVNQTKSADTMQRITRRLLKREQKKRQTLKEMGIEYDFPGYKESAKTMMELKSNAENSSPSSVTEEAKEGSDKKKRKVSLDETSEKETSDAVAEGKSGKKSAKKQRKLSDASDAKASKSVDTAKKERKSSDASAETGKVTKKKKKKSKK